MMESVNHFVKMCSTTLICPEPIYEFGAFQVPGQEAIANLRVFFPGRTYVGADMREGPGVDIVLNLHHIDLPDASVGTVLLLETLEHVEYPRKAIDEVYRILKPDGILIVSTPLGYIIHNFPYDYWRFTPDGMKSLLKPFHHSIVSSVGESLFPQTVVGIGFKGSVDGQNLDELQRNLNDWKRHWTASLRAKGFKRFLKFLNRLDDQIHNTFNKLIKK